MEAEIICKDPQTSLFTATEILMVLVFLYRVLIKTTHEAAPWDKFKWWNMPVLSRR